MSDEKPRKSYASEYEALLDHPFFHDIARTDIPIMEEMKAEHFKEMPLLYEVYRNREEAKRIVIHENMSSESTEIKGREVKKTESIILIAFHLPKRFVIWQELNTYDCIKANLLGLWYSGSGYAKLLHFDFTRYEQKATTRSGKIILDEMNFANNAQTADKFSL